MRGELTASGWLKVHRYAEVPEQDRHFPLLSIYMTIVWRLVVRGFLGGFRSWGLGLKVWTSLKEDALLWLTSRWGEISVRILRGG
jgi:hypothetical protein